jgi:hypothetical protein
MNIDRVLNAYAVCALWSSSDDEGEPLDGSYSLDDIAPKTWQAMREDVIAFCAIHKPLIEEAGIDEEQVGHDLWLTRNHHGAGFWDRGLGEVGEKLTKAANSFGGVDLYVGDDGMVHA